MGIINSLTPEQKDARKLADLLWAEFSQLKAANSARLGRYADFEAEYESHRDPNHRPFLDDYGRGKKETTGDKRRHRIKIPYQHAITTKHTYRTAGQMPDLIVPRRDASDPERFRGDTMEKMLYAAYGYSSAELQFASGDHDCSLLGAGCYDLYWNADRQLPRFRSIHPAGVLTVDGIEDPHDFKRVYRFWRVGKHSFRLEYGDLTLPGGEQVADIRCEEGTEDIQMVRYSDAEKTVTMAGGVILTKLYHGYGFTPYVVIPNLGPIRKVWGYGDYEFYRDLIKYFEVLVNRQADVIGAAAGGAYLEQNTGQTGGTIIRILRTGGIVHGRKDSSLTPIEVAKMPDFIDSHFQMIRQALDDIGFTPPAAWGAIGSTSGSDRALQMAPQVELTALKQIHRSAGLKRLNTMILRLIEAKTLDGPVKYTGTQQKRRITTPFSITLGAAVSEAQVTSGPDGSPTTNDDGTMYQVPTSPKEVIAGEYDTDVKWDRRVDREDPTFILAELNKFQQGAQSLETTLRNLGFEDPEAEMHRIENEANRFPWIHQGLIAMVKAQLDAQNQGGGSSQPDGGGGGGDLAAALGTAIQPQGGLGQDAVTRGLNGKPNGNPPTQGSPGGATYGGQ